MSNANAQADTNDSFLSGGLVYNLLLKSGLAEIGMKGVRLRAISLICLTYVPLVVLSFMQGEALGTAVKIPFLYDLSEICRFLLVAPLLIAAEVFIEPWLLQVVSHTRTQLMPEAMLPEFEKLLAGAVRWRDSYIIEILLLIAAFFGPSLDTSVLPSAVTSTWHILPTNNQASYAGIYYAHFAKPLVRFLWLRWLWRYMTWSVFIIRLSKMPLKLLATHPDRKAGLAFIAIGHTRFSALAFALGLQASGILGTQILFTGKTLMSFKYEILGILAIVLTLFLTPLLAYTGKLLNAKRLGLFDYGALADQYTEAFHKKWISGEHGTEPLLGTSDIQSLADLSNSYEIVNEMKSCLIGKTIAITFTAATLVPFAPLVLTVYPFDELVRNLLKAVM